MSLLVVVVSLQLRGTTEHTEYTEARHNGGGIRFRVFGVFRGYKSRIAAQAQIQLPNWVDPYLVVKDTRRILEAVS